MSTASTNLKSTPQKWKSILLLIVLLLWGVFQIYRGHYFYTVALIALFIVTIRKASFSNVLLYTFVVLLIFSQTKVLDAWSDLRKDANQFFENPGAVLSNLFTPDSGSDTFTLELQDTVALTREQNIPNYRFSERIAADDELVLPIYDSSFPALYDEDSLYVFMFNDEIGSYPDCKIVDKGRYITLGYCD